MNIIVVGGGGREHAIIKKIKENTKVKKIYALPGNGGMAGDAELVDIMATDIKGIVDFAKNNDIDLAIVSPDDPLVMGAVDELEKVGIKTFGPNKRAAIIEGSKIFSKNLMKKYNIPTAKYEVFTEIDDALDYAEICPIPTVLKADGLALGKGVIIATTREELKMGIINMMEDKAFGDSGSRVIIEEFLEGPEVSVLAFTDGKTIVPMVSSMDHKRALDGDKGLNTGGMGTIAPNPFYTKDIEKIAMKEIFMPTLRAMNKENRKFKGCLYFGLMITKDGPKVIEYNCRFGDPEAQVVLPLLKTDLLEIMLKICEDKLSEIEIEFLKEYACCVVMASKGYPKSYEKGFPIELPKSDTIFVAGAKLEDGKLLSDGGRVLGVTEKGSTLEIAVAKAYNTIHRVNFINGYYRTDIGSRALNKEI